MCRAKDITGLHVGSVVVTGRAGKQGNLALWRGVCSCGRETVRQLSAFTSGTAISCASCGRSRRNTRHGMLDHPLYSRWTAMWSRCTDESNKDYRNYGGRGISVYPAWASFPLYASYMDSLVPPYFPGATVDRRDNEKGYVPGNVRWATTKEQANNTRKSMNGEQ